MATPSLQNVLRHHKSKAFTVGEYEAATITKEHAGPAVNDFRPVDYPAFDGFVHVGLLGEVLGAQNFTTEVKFPLWLPTSLEVNLAI